MSDTMVAPEKVEERVELDEETRDVLRRAKEMVLLRGWTQGSEGMLARGPHCVLGALAAGTPGLASTTLYYGDPEKPAYSMCWEDDRSVAALGFGSFFQAFAWNDHPDRTQAEVVDRFDRALAGDFK